MHKNQPSIMQAATAKRPWLWLVLVGFLWLQLTGVVHKHAHTELQTGLQQTSAQFEKILPEHSQQNKSDCQLLDLQCTGLALSQALPVLALPVFSLPAVWHETTAFFNLTWLVYQARAPPQSSI